MEELIKNLHDEKFTLYAIIEQCNYTISLKGINASQKEFIQAKEARERIAGINTTLRNLYKLSQPK